MSITKSDVNYLISLVKADVEKYESYDKKELDSLIARIKET